LAVSLGDRAWAELLERYHELVREALEHDDVAGFDVRSGVLEDAEIAARRVVQSTGWHRFQRFLSRPDGGLSKPNNAERLFWQTPGVYTTAAGYAGGLTPNPTYEEVCSGRTGHAEVVLAVFDPARTSYEEMLRVFWEGHDPTQGMRQGNDVGTQYRSAVYWHDERQRHAALSSRDTFQDELTRAGYGQVTTEIV
jgi:methionine-S-sulfoxide reductase